MPLVSVLMPVFNRETLVEGAIDSIRNQTFEDWELIILDDGSTDRTLEVCRSYETRDNRIRAFANERNLGIGETRTRLISYATGKYIAHQDSDDFSVPERLALEVSLLEARPEIGLVSGVAVSLDDEDNILQYIPNALFHGIQYPQVKSEMVTLLYEECNIAEPACLFRSHLLNEIPVPYGNYRAGADWYFFLHLAHRTLVWGIPKVLVKMRRGTSHMHIWKDFTTSELEVLKIKRSIYDIYKNDPTSPINHRLYRQAVARSLLKQGRYVGAWKGYFLILQSVVYFPFNKRAWKSLWEFTGRALRRGARFAFKSIGSQSCPS